MKLNKLLIKVMILALPVSAFADIAAIKERVPEIVSLKEKGVVGEQPDGMLGLVKDDAAAKAIVDAENKDRLDEYTKRAATQGQPVDMLMKVLGEARIRQEKDGRFVRDAEGKWLKKK